MPPDPVPPAAPPVAHPLPAVMPLAVVFLALVALMVVMEQAESILSPIVLGIVTGIVLSPLSELWERWGFPPVAGALASLFLTLAATALLVLLVQPVAYRLVSQAPKVLADMQETVDSISVRLRSLRNATEVVAEALGETDPAPTVTTEGLPSVADVILLAPAMVAQATIFAGVLFFFLMTRHELYAGIGQLLPGTETVQIVARLRRAERHVARYFLTVSLVNIGLGLATAAALRLMGLPDAVLWGVVATLFNYIVYLGPVIVALALIAAGVAAFDGAMSLAPALGFLALNFLEGQFITPSFVGRQMRLNPLVVFVALVVGMWLWGAVGGIVALPIAIWVRVMRDERELSLARLPDNAIAAVIHEESGTKP
ncbi:MAG: AI-2E family transporter [Rhodobacteraceae bacterium PARR1]|nr:MAG: AI-2E family transporter [Rhodobacteraceae bacterium PARR1]